MRVGKQDFDSTSGFDEVLEAFNNLPPAIPTRAPDRPPTTISFAPDSQAFQDYEAAKETHRNFIDNPKDSSRFDEALRARILCIKRAEEDGDAFAEAFHSEGCAVICALADQYEMAIRYFEKPRSVYKDQKRFDWLYLALGALHDAMLKNIQKKEQEGAPQEEMDKLWAELRPLRLESIEAKYRMNHEVIDESAYLVREGEGAISSGPPLGTNNVQECVFLILYKPDQKTPELLVEHINHQTTIAALEETYKEFALSSSPSTPYLQGGIVGARYSHPKNSEAPPSEGAVKSKSNLQKIKDFLADKPVEIVVTQILDFTQPSGMVVYLRGETFEIREALPGIFDPDGPPFGLPCFQIGLDLTVCNERAPTLLDSQTASYYAYWAHTNNTEKKLYEWHRKHAQTDVSELPSSIEKEWRYIEGYKKTMSHVLNRLERKLDRLRSDPLLSGPPIRINENEHQQAIEAIRRCEIHIGNRANDANQPLIDFVERTNGLITINRINNERVAQFNFGQLKQFKFPKRPYDTVIEAQRRKRTANSPPLPPSTPGRASKKR